MLSHQVLDRDWARAIPMGDPIGDFDVELPNVAAAGTQKYAPFPVGVLLPVYFNELILRRSGNDNHFASIQCKATPKYGFIASGLVIYGLIWIG